MFFQTKRLLSLAVLGLALVPVARAEPIDFSYAWTVLAPSTIPSGTGSVTITATMPGTATYDTTSALPTYIPGAELTTSSSATSPADSFNTPFNLQLTLTDTDLSVSKDFTFSGTLAGTLTATTSTLTGTFTNPVTQEMTLGSYIYTVTIGPTLVNLPGPTSGSPALIDARITARLAEEDDDDEVPVNETPEPGTLLLGASAAVGLLARRYWRR